MKQRPSKNDLKYMKLLLSLIDYYNHRHILINVDGSKSIDEVSEDILEKLKGEENYDNNQIPTRDKAYEKSWRISCLDIKRNRKAYKAWNNYW